MDQYFARSVVWASARGDIFWPGQVGFQFYCSFLFAILYVIDALHAIVHG